MIKTDKLIITVCPCGSFMTREHNPNMPVQPDEIAEEVYRSWNEGASIVHIHARDRDGKATTDPEVFREIHRRIREKGCDIILQHSTSPGRERGARIEDGFRSLEAGPEMATVDVEVLVTDATEDDPRVYTRSFIRKLAGTMLEKGIKPEMEMFNSGAFEEAERLIKQDLLTKPYWFGFALDNQRSAQIVTPYSPKALMFFADMLPQEAMFTTLAVAATETPAAVMSIILGGHARVGFEDNVMLRKGVLAKSNAELVARIARIGADLGRTVASPEEARDLLGIPRLKKV